MSMSSSSTLTVTALPQHCSGGSNTTITRHIFPVLNESFSFIKYNRHSQAEIEFKYTFKYKEVPHTWPCHNSSCSSQPNENTLMMITNEVGHGPCFKINRTIARLETYHVTNLNIEFQT